MKNTLDAALSVVCGADDLSRQKKRYGALAQNFEETFAQKATGIFSAPGRTEILGNHTDHQGGRVVAAAVNLDTIAAVSKTDDNIITIYSEGFEPTKIDLNDLGSNAGFSSKGLALEVCRQFATDPDKNIGGCNIYMSSEVLKGSGLSSSAAYLTALTSIFNDLYNDNRLTAMECAKIGKNAENTNDKSSGLMDQAASAHGGCNSFDFSSPDVTVNPMDFAPQKHGYTMIIIDTGVSHAGLDDVYSTVPKDMCAVAKMCGEEQLCRVPEAKFRRLTGLDEGKRLRAEHFYEETARVPAFEAAVQAGDWRNQAEIIAASGNSSRLKNKNVDHPKIAEYGEALTHAAAFEGSVARVHGGGFGGTLQAYVPTEKVADFVNHMESFSDKIKCMPLKIRNSGACRVLTEDQVRRLPRPPSIDRKIGHSR